MRRHLLSLAAGALALVLLATAGPAADKLPATNKALIDKIIGTYDVDPSASEEGLHGDVKKDGDPQSLFQALQNRGERTTSEQLGLYLMDLESKQVVPIVDEPVGEFTYFGSPQWSPDGSQIVYDATPGMNWDQSHIKLIQLDHDDIVTTDLGPGNCPTFSPDGSMIAFLVNPGAVPDARTGLWIMNADGTRRQRLTEGAIPKWSPAGDKILNSSFGNPQALSLLDADDGGTQPIEFPGKIIRAHPSWLDSQTLVVPIHSEDDESEQAIVLVDISNPDKAKIKRTLLTRDEDFRPWVLYPDYSAVTDECVFVGGQNEGTALYHVQGDGKPERLEPERDYDNKIEHLTLSPDGRYLLFCSDRNAN